MPLSYRTILSHLLSYRFANPLRPAPLRRDRAKRGGLMEFLETRDLFSAAPTVLPFQENLSRGGTFTFNLTDFNANTTPANSLSDVEFTTLPAHGTITFAGSSITINQDLSASGIGSGLLIYTPDAGFAGNDTLTWIGADDGVTFTDPLNAATITMDVVNHPPVLLSNATRTAVENDPNAFTLANFSAFFSDADLDSLQSIQIQSLPSNGTLTLNGNPVSVSDTIAAANISLLTYTPNNGFTGTDTFTWNASDGLANATFDANYTLTVTNAVPTASNITIPVALNANTSLTSAEFAAAFHDADAPLDTFQGITVITLPSNGTLSLNGSPVTANQTIDSANLTNLVYTSTGTGTFTFTFKVSDGKATSATPATASLIATPPTVTPIFTNVLPNTTTAAPLAFTLSEFTSAFHAVSPLQLQSIKIVTLPPDGTLYLNGVALTSPDVIIDSANITNLTYTPNASFIGTDTINWNGSDGGSYAVTGSTITIAVDTAPVVTDFTVIGDVHATSIPVSTANLTNFKAHFTDADPSLPNTLQFVKITKLPTNGFLAEGANGTHITLGQILSTSELGILTYSQTTNPNSPVIVTGSDTFGYTASDGSLFATNHTSLANSTDPNAATDGTSAIVTINATANTPPVATDIAANVSHLANLTIAPTSLGFTDADAGDVLAAVTFVTIPSHGTLFFGGSGNDPGTKVTAGLELPASTPITYVPKGDLNIHSDSFTYKVFDGFDFSANAANFTVNLTNNPPVLHDRSSNFVENAVNPVPLSDFTINNGFTDADTGDSIKFIKFVTLPAHGTFNYQGTPIVANQTIPTSDISNLTFTPNNNFVNLDSFKWNASDGFDFAANNANFTIVVENVPPVLSNITIPIAQSPANTTLTSANFLTGFTDANAPLDTMKQIKIVTLPSHGNLTFNGSLVTANQIIDTANISLLQYVPNAGSATNDSFTFNASDGKDFSNNTATASLNITFPTVANISFVAAPGTPATLSSTVFAPGFSDTVNNATLQAVKIVTLPLHGTLALNGTPVTANATITSANLATLTYTPTGTFKGSDSFKYNASDFASGGDFAVNSANFNILVDHIPTIGNGTKVANIGSNITFTLADFTSLYADADNDPLASITITALPANGTLRVGSSPVTANQTISAANLTRLTYVPASAGAFFFSFTASDGFANTTSAANYTITNHTIPDVSAVNFFAQPGVTFTFPTSQFISAFTGFDSNASLKLIEFTTLPSHGTLELDGTPITANQSISFTALSNGTSNLTYSPSSGFTGSDTFTWSGSANNSSPTGGIQFATTAANITVTQAFPDVSNITISGITGQTIILNNSNVSNNANFTQVFRTGLSNVKMESVIIQTLPAHGTLTIGGVPVNAGQVFSNTTNSQLVYTPNTNFYGTDSFKFNESDGFNFALTDSSVTYISGTPPTIANASNPATVGTPILFNQSEFDSPATFTDAGNLSLASIKITALPTSGNLLLNGRPVTLNQTINASLLSNLTYTATSNPGIDDSFTFTANDAVINGVLNTKFSFTNNTRPILANITISATNANISFTAAEFNAGFTDSDGSGNNTLQEIILTSLPSHGNLFYNGTLVTSADLANVHSTSSHVPFANISLLTYTPAPGYLGADSFKWNASDGAITANTSASANITIAAPVVSNFTLPVTPAGVTFTQVEFSNSPTFTDVVNAATAQTVRIDSLPAHGTLTLSGVAVTANQSITATNLANLTYTPAAGYHGTDSFKFNTSDGIFFAVHDASVNLIVDNAPSLGNGTKPESGGTTKAFALTDFTSVFTDLDAKDKLTTITITVLPTKGALALSGVPVTAGQVISAANITHLTYAPNSAGIDTFQWTASDGLLSSTAATFTLDNNSPPSVANITLSGVTGTPVNISLANFTTAFTDPESSTGGTFGTIQQVKIVSLPANGTLSLGNVTVTKGQIISVANLPNLAYLAKPGFVGVDKFTYTSSDGQDFAAANATVSLSQFSLFDVLGNSAPIVNGETSPTVANFTDFAAWTILPDASMQNDTRTFTLQNSGNTTIGLGNITSSNPDFIVTAADSNISLANATIAPGGTLDITIQFNPTTAGKKTSNITITDVSNATLFTYEVQGTALLTTKLPAVSFAGGGTATNGVVQIGTQRNGSGSGATNGQVLGVKYTGYLANGTIFDASSLHGNTTFFLRLDDLFTNSNTTNQPYLSKDKTFGFNSVDGGVIAGWEYGLQGAKVGETRTLVINSDAGYGAGGSPNSQDPSRSIPGDSTLIFDIQIVSLSTKPQLGVMSLNSALNQITGYIQPGQHTISAGNDTKFLLASNQSTLSQTFLLSTNGTVDQSGTAVSNWAFFGKKPIRITGSGAKDFTFTVSGNELTIKFDPQHPGLANATVHILTTDPVNRDYTFDIQGNSAPAVDITTNFGIPKFPKTAIVAGSGQTLTFPVVVVNSGNTPVPANSKTNVQVYIENTANQTLTLIKTINNLSISGLGAGGQRKLNITSTLPASVLTGTYQIVAVTNSNKTLLPGAAVDPTLAVTAESLTTNDSGSISTTFPVVQGTNTLAGSISANTLAAANHSVSGNVTLSLRNSGTIPLPQDATATVTLIAHPVSDAGTDRDQILNPGFSISLTQLGGGSRSFTIPASVAANFPFDSYIIEAIVTPDQVPATTASNITLNSDNHGNLVTLNYVATV